MMSRSLMKRRFEGEMSTVPSAPMGVCSPPVPLTERPSGLHTALALASVPSAVKLGILTWTDACVGDHQKVRFARMTRRRARMPVPRLLGQLVT